MITLSNKASYISISRQEHNDPSKEKEKSYDLRFENLLEQFGEQAFITTASFKKYAPCAGFSPQEIAHILHSIGSLPEKDLPSLIKRYPVRFHFRTMKLRYCDSLPPYRAKTPIGGLTRNSIPDGPINDVIQSIRQKEHFTPLEEASPLFLYLLLRLEDPTFFAHKGISFINILCGLRTGFVYRKIMWGGSTITQQLVKTLFFDVSERSLSRKIRELPKVFWFERHLSKREILELYINSIEYGNGSYSIYEAARDYFGISPGELSFGQSLMLCSIIANPKAFNPVKKHNMAKSRQMRSASFLYDNYLISEKDYNELAANSELQSSGQQQWFKTIFKRRFLRAANERKMLDCSPLFIREPVYRD